MQCVKSCVFVLAFYLTQTITRCTTINSTLHLKVHHKRQIVLTNQAHLQQYVLAKGRPLSLTTSWMACLDGKKIIMLIKEDSYIKILIAKIQIIVSSNINFIDPVENKSCKSHHTMDFFVFHFLAIWLVTLNKPWNLIGCFVLVFLGNGVI